MCYTLPIMKDRVRISITLRPEIVNLLDSKIDGTKIRNRSHAVEQFLKQSLTSPVGQAIIFIGDENKVLTSICGESVLEKNLKQLAKASVYKIIICCTQQSQKLKKFLTKKQFSKFQFIFTKNENRGTGTALYQCKEHLSPGTFLLIYGDVMAEIDYYDLMDFHKNSSALATMVITSIADPLPWGVVRVKRSRIMDFTEKPGKTPEQEKRLTNLINAGIYVFEQEIFGSLNRQTRSLEQEIFPKLIEKGKFYSYLLDGAWFNVSRPKMMEHAIKYCSLQ